MNEYKIHPAAEVFPLITGVELAELVDDIREHGLKEPIKLLGELVIDGRNRLRACVIAGVEPKFVEVHKDTVPSEYVITANLRRRHLTASERAVAGAKLAKIMEKEGRERRQQNLQKPNDLPKASGDAFEKTQGKSTAAAARITGASTSSVERAKRVLDSGREDLIQELEDNVPVAKVAAKLKKPEKASSKPQDEREQPEAPKTPPSTDTASEPQGRPNWPPPGKDKALDRTRRLALDEIRKLRGHLSGMGLRLRFEPVLQEMEALIK